MNHWSTPQRKNTPCVRTIRALIIAFLFLLGSGCAWLNTYHNKDELGSDLHLVSVDAKQRFLLSRDVKKGNETLRKICAEPSPDVFSAFAASLTGSAKTKAFEATLNAAFSENAATIGIRTQAIQLLRDGMYRICEGVLNGTVTNEQFVDLHRRYQRIMVTLVAIEQLTGAVRPPSVAIQTDALAGRPARLNDLQDELEQATSKVSTLETEVETAGSENEFQRTVDDNTVDVACRDATEEELQDEENCSDLVTAKTNLESAKANVKTLEKEIEAARSEIVNRASGSVTLVDNRSSNFNLDSKSVKEIADTIQSMVASMFRLDPDTAIGKYIEMGCGSIEAQTKDSAGNFIVPSELAQLNSLRQSLKMPQVTSIDDAARESTASVITERKPICSALVQLIKNNLEPQE